MVRAAALSRLGRPFSLVLIAYRRIGLLKNACQAHEHVLFRVMSTQASRNVTLRITISVLLRNPNTIYHMTSVIRT